MKLTKKKLDKLEVLIDLLDDMTCLDSTTLNDLAQSIRTANKELKSDSLHGVSYCVTKDFYGELNYLTNDGVFSLSKKDAQHFTEDESKEVAKDYCAIVTTLLLT